jgi:hypothetical protein
MAHGLQVLPYSRSYFTSIVASVQAPIATEVQLECVVGQTGWSIVGEYYVQTTGTPIRAIMRTFIILARFRERYPRMPKRVGTSCGDHVTHVPRILRAGPLIGQAVLDMRHFAILHKYSRVKAYESIAEPVHNLVYPV